jgi:hypothetical protein
MLSSMPAIDEATKAYIDYLDKEMTIMGILSTFCVAAAALVIDRISSAESHSFFARLATAHPVQIYVGSGLLMLAGLYFYLQRSRLAHFYGSICMSIIMPQLHEWSTERWLVEAYSWATWLRYRIAFMLLTLTVVVFGFAICETIYPSQHHLWLYELPLLVLIAAGTGIHTMIYMTYRYNNNPYHCFSVRTFRKDWRTRKELRNVGGECNGVDSLSLSLSLSLQKGAVVTLSERALNRSRSGS